MTKAEKELWYKTLAKRQFRGLRFLRQRAIDRYIVDFFCPELKLVIEVDGISHHYDDAVSYDIQRQEMLEALGYHVIRLSDFEIFNQQDVEARTREVDTLERLTKEVNNLTPPPAPSLSLQKRYHH